MINLRNSTLTFFFLSLLLVACEKQELPVPAHEPGDVITTAVSMESDYRYQLFFDLETNTMVQRNLKVDWDLGFESSSLGNKVILNTSKFMLAANTNQTIFSSVIDTVGYHFNWDAPSGNMDSTAIGDWIGTQNVYVIDRGYDPLGGHQGFKKIIFELVNNNEYKVRFANLDGTNEMNQTIIKNANYNFTFLSLDGNLVEVEPEKEEWDLSFSQYIHVFDEQNGQTPYLVNGVLSNRNKVEVATVFDKDFSAITFDDVSAYTFSTTINRIGYDWKEYSFSTSSFTVFTDKNYLIKSTEGKYYKLHFIDFYDNFGTKGTPTFEFQEL